MSKLKVIAITKKLDYYRIGENFNYSAWYATKNVKDSPVSQGDLVEIEYEKEGKENVLKTIKVVGKAESNGNGAETTTASSTATSSASTWRAKSPEESNTIRKQTVGKMVAETLNAMDLTGSGIADVLPLIDELFKKYDELTK